jgi:hypothetical protein
MKTVKESFKRPSLSGFLGRLKAFTMRLVFKEASKVWFKLVLFFTFCDVQLLYYKNRHIVTATNVTICDKFVTRYKRSQ